MHACRCCLRTDCYKDIYNEYYYRGIKEVYSDLLINTFNITISQLNEEGPGGRMQSICNSCISRLRDAATFRHQILKTEAYFTEHYNKLRSAEEALFEECNDMKSELSVEPADLETADDDEEVLSLDDVNTEDIEECDYKTDLTRMEEVSQKHQQTIENQEQNQEDKITSNNIKKKIIDEKIQNEETKTPKHHTRPSKKTQDEINMIQNTTTLLINSNICPFRSLQTKYKCYYCTKDFMQIIDLRNHNENTHTNEIKIKKTIQKSLYYIKAEISNLSCKLCLQKFTKIIELQDHLICNHNINFNSEKNNLIPYTIVEKLQCALCETIFKTFTKLSNHMHLHFPNYICEHCGSGFTDKAKVKAHLKTTHYLKKCTLCQEKFLTRTLLIHHRLKIHGFKREYKRYCKLCKDVFSYTHQLNDHMIAKHGKKQMIFSCKECGKSFNRELYLKSHIKAVHLKERNYSCDVCSSVFFKKSEKVRHELVHVQDGKKYECQVCGTLVKSKDSLRRHVKKHGN